MGNIRIGQKGVDSIFREIFTYRMNLRVLNLDSNYLDGLWLKEIKNFALFQMTVTHLSMNSCRLSNHDVEDLFDGLKGNPTIITYLGLSNNRLSDETIVTIAPYLRQRYKKESGQKAIALEEIDLSDNSIGEQGGLEVAQIIKSNQNLHRLNLKNNAIGTNAARAILQSIKDVGKRLSLQHLNIEMNNVEFNIKGMIQTFIKNQRLRVTKRQMPFFKSEIRTLKRGNRRSENRQFQFLKCEFELNQENDITEKMRADMREQKHKEDHQTKKLTDIKKENAEQLILVSEKEQRLDLRLSKKKKRYSRKLGAMAEKIQELTDFNSGCSEKIQETKEFKENQVNDYENEGMKLELELKEENHVIKEARLQASAIEHQIENLREVVKSNKGKLLARIKEIGDEFMDVEVLDEYGNVIPNDLSLKD